MDGRFQRIKEMRKMPDITKCVSKECPIRQDCLRWTSGPTPLGQSWSNFYRKGQGRNCEFYIPKTSEEQSDILNDVDRERNLERREQERNEESERRD